MIICPWYLFKLVSQKTLFRSKIACPHGINYWFLSITKQKNKKGQGTQKTQTGKNWMPAVQGQSWQGWQNVVLQFYLRTTKHQSLPKSIKSSYSNNN